MNCLLTPPQRPLEFRAWHIPTQRLCQNVAFDPFNANKIIYLNKKGSASHIGKDGTGQYITTHFDSLDREDCILMQFTGLYDSQGQKVFEGDVIYSYYEGDSDGWNPSSEYWRVIAYREGCFCELQHPDEEATIYNFEPTNCEHDTVVGCHYVRPDLLALNTESGLVPDSFFKLTAELSVIT